MDLEGMTSPLREIVAELLVPATEFLPRIPKQQVMEWMRSGDIEALGALSTLMMDARHYNRIEPALSIDDSYPFWTRFYERCLKENPDGDWSETRYGAGRELVGWFESLWTDADTPPTILAELKAWLSHLYLEGDDELRLCIETATLEHLFENVAIARFFSDWKMDPVLAGAYERSMDWGMRGGNPQSKPG